MMYLGIDPGQSGGIAVLSATGEARAYKMPQTEKDTSELFESLKTANFAIIEKVHSMPGQGVSSSFKFGKNYGALRMALIAHGIPFDEHSPQKWMKWYGLKKSKTESKTQWKNRLKAKAQQLFPGIKVTLATADALLIANYCRVLILHTKEIK